MNPRQQILSAVEIRWPEAAWVLGAHLFAVIVPLVLCVAVYSHWDYLLATTYRPFLFYVAVGMFCAASAFEVAQNAIDKWYLTENTGSTTDASFCDFLFFLMATTGQAVCAIVTAVAIVGAALWPFLTRLPSSRRVARQ